MGYINKSIEKFIEDLTELCRQPSISAQGVGIRECAELVKGMMGDVGIATRVLSVKDGNPAIYGEVKSEENDRTLIFYNHYDVQPPEPIEKWLFDPFSAKIYKGRIYARGASDNKGNLVARLKATEVLLKTFGSTPVNLKFFFEGEEEVGSPHLPSVVEENRQLLSADGCIWEGSRKDFSERPVIYLGSKGMLRVELRVKGAKTELHSRWAPIVSNPTWRLISALGTMKDQDGKITIDGFYDSIIEPSPEEIEMLDLTLEDEERLKRVLGVENFLRELSGRELMKSLLFEPTCTVTTINPWFPERKTALPSEATTRIHFRLVMGQRPRDILEKFKTHLRKFGFDDIKVNYRGEMEPTKTSISEDISKLSIKTARRIYGVEPAVQLTAPGASPMYYFNNWLRIPTVSACGVGYAGSNVHAPDENIRIKDYIDGIRYLVSFISSF